MENVQYSFCTSICVSECVCVEACMCGSVILSEDYYRGCVIRLLILLFVLVCLTTWKWRDLWWDVQPVICRYSMYTHVDTYTRNMYAHFKANYVCSSYVMRVTPNMNQKHSNWRRDRYVDTYNQWYVDIVCTFIRITSVIHWSSSYVMSAYT